MATTMHSHLALDPLRAALRGRLITPDHAEYDAMRRVVSGEVDDRPAAIARPVDAADVARVVDIAREHGLELAVRSGGHSGAGHSTVEGGLVLDLRDLTSLQIDVDGRTAWAGAGLTAGAYTTAVGEHGLATGFGDTGSVGLGGITTGGGVGYLSRKHGLTIDSLLAAEVVTADGQVRLVDEDHAPDLFWAIRGGGGNLGVVTRFRYRLHDVSSTVGGILVLPATPSVVAGFMAAAAAAPNGLSTIANVMPCPPLPFVDESIHGRPVVFAILLWSGDPAEGERELQAFRDLATPHADLLRPMAYAEIYPPEEFDPDYRPTAVARNLFMDGFDLAAAERIMAALDASEAPMRVAQLRVLGGAIADVPNDATAYAHRDRAIMVNVAAFYVGAEDRAAKAAWVDELADGLRQGPPAAYVNFVGAEGEAGVRAAYPATTYARLAAIKGRYDPGNLFRRNQNVPPQASTAG
jgi:FAD/FMN-containing dehydrogenase